MAWFSAALRTSFKRRSLRRPGQSAGERTRFEKLEARALMTGDAVLTWNSVALDAVAADFALGHTPAERGPTATSRALAIVQVAIFDAANSITHTDVPCMVSLTAPKEASVDAAIAQAGHDALTALYPDQKARFDAALDSSLAGINPLAKVLGCTVGSLVAAKCMALRANDGATAVGVYTPTGQPGNHVADPMHPNQGYLGPDWGQVKPFVMSQIDQFQAPPPPALNSAEYTAAYNEVKNYGGDGVTTPTLRTPEQTQIGIFWSYDGSPGLGVPPRMYNQIAQTIAVQQHNTEMQNARMFALINMAMADAGIASWNTKYTYDFWRPVVGIRQSDPGTGPTGLGDGNPNTVGDPNWTPLGAQMDNGMVVNMGANYTPNFPSYDSGHATFGAALFTVLKDFYGTDNIHFTIGSDEYNGVTKDANNQVRPLVTRSFSSFSQASAENAQSRIYLGVHWQFDATAAVTQGNAIGEYVFHHAAMNMPSWRDLLSSALAAAQTFTSQATNLLPGFGANHALAASFGHVSAGGTAGANVTAAAQLLTAASAVTPLTATSPSVSATSAALSDALWGVTSEGSLFDLPGSTKKRSY